MSEPVTGEHNGEEVTVLTIETDGENSSDVADVLADFGVEITQTDADDPYDADELETFDDVLAVEQAENEGLWRSWKDLEVLFAHPDNMRYELPAAERKLRAENKVAPDAETPTTLLEAAFLAASFGRSIKGWRAAGTDGDTIRVRGSRLTFTKKNLAKCWRSRGFRAFCRQVWGEFASGKAMPLEDHSGNS